MGNDREALFRAPDSGFARRVNDGLHAASVLGGGPKEEEMVGESLAEAMDTVGHR